MDDVEKIEIQKYLSELPILLELISTNKLFVLKDGALFQVDAEKFQASVSGNSYIRQQATQQAIGGIPKGYTPNGTIQQTLDQMLFPPEKASISLSFIPLQEKGTTYNLLLTGSITPGDSTISYRKLLKNGQEIKSFENDNISYSESLQVNTNFSLAVETDLGVISGVRSLEFVAPTFAGTIKYAEFEASILNATTTVNSLEDQFTKLIRKKGSITYSFSPNEERYVLGYPKAFGQLTRITDQNKFNTVGFLLFETSIQLSDGSSEAYYFYVYRIDNTWDAFSFTFEY